MKDINRSKKIPKFLKISTKKSEIMIQKSIRKSEKSKTLIKT